jgi:hypothetical protein
LRARRDQLRRHRRHCANGIDPRGYQRGAHGKLIPGRARALGRERSIGPQLLPLRKLRLGLLLPVPPQLLLLGHSGLRLLHAIIALRLRLLDPVNPRRLRLLHAVGAKLLPIGRLLSTVRVHRLGLLNAVFAHRTRRHIHAFGALRPLDCRDALLALHARSSGRLTLHPRGGEGLTLNSWCLEGLTLNSWRLEGTAAAVRLSSLGAWAAPAAMFARTRAGRGRDRQSGNSCNQIGSGHDKSPFERVERAVSRAVPCIGR